MDNPVQISAREFAELVAQTKQNTELLQSVIKLLQGNGHAGVIVRMDRIERAIDIDHPETISDRLTYVEKELNRLTSIISKLMWGLIFPFVLGLVGFIIGLLTHTIELRFN